MVALSGERNASQIDPPFNHKAIAPSTRNLPAMERWAPQQCGWPIVWWWPPMPCSLAVHSCTVKVHFSLRLNFFQSPSQQILPSRWRDLWNPFHLLLRGLCYPLTLNGFHKFSWCVSWWHYRCSEQFFSKRDTGELNPRRLLLDSRLPGQPSVMSVLWSR